MSNLRPWMGREDEMIQAYQNGERVRAITQRFSVSSMTLFAILREHDVPMRGFPSELKYDAKAVIADYQAGMPLAEITKKHGFSHPQVLYPILRRHGIVATGHGGNQPLSLKPFKPAFFGEQTKETAYWCGFLMADGSIRRDRDGSNSWALSLSLHEKDAEHHYAFCDAIGVDRKFVRWYDSRYKSSVSRMQSITVYHKSLPDLLRPWGVVSHKTHVFEIPQVSDDLLPSYLCGWADGDGNVRVTKPPVFQVTGNYQALCWYKEAMQRLGYAGNIYVKQAAGKDWGRLSVHSLDSVRAVARLLQVQEFCLERKWRGVLDNE